METNPHEAAIPPLPAPDYGRSLEGVTPFGAVPAWPESYIKEYAQNYARAALAAAQRGFKYERETS